MSTLKQDEIRQAVRKTYGQIAQSDAACGCGPSCCDSGAVPGDAKAASMGFGYSSQEVEGIPDGANMGLGCGNPQAIAALKPGETVLDLGSGGGFDCFLAAKQVGESGKVIGVDMTPDMVSKARSNAHKGGYGNVEFRLGEIENLPVADGTVDVIISNCVINLSPDKQQVFRDAFRVLKSGGRLAISDIVATIELPEEMKSDLALYSGCMAGATPIAELEAMLRIAGFENVAIVPKDESRAFIRDWAPGRKIEDFVVSAQIQGTKP